MSPTTGPYADSLARALHDADCGCGTYDEVEDSRYITAARAALAAAATPAPQPADVVRDLDPVQLVALHEAVRDALVVKGIGRTDPSAICSATPAPPAGPQEFVLRPPLGWLNRVDEVLSHHGAADHDGSPLGEALANLIRSWRGDRDDDFAPGPENWGPTGEQHAATPAPPVDVAAVLESIVRWVDAMRSQDWSVYPEQYGAGKSRAVEEIAQLLLPATTPAAPVDVAARLRAMADAATAARYHEVERGLNTAGLWCERDPQLAQAIARALTGEATS